MYWGFFAMSLGASFGYAFHEKRHDLTAMLLGAIVAFTVTTVTLDLVLLAGGMIPDILVWRYGAVLITLLVRGGSRFLRTGSSR